MKKIFSFFAIAALAIMGLSSCNGIEETQPVANDAYTLTIAGTVEDQFSENTTKGLQLVAFPDWREIAEEYIHIFENGVEGKDPKFEIKPDSYNRLAYFTATFGGAEEGEEIPIIAPTTKAGGYEYNAIIAPGTDGVYTVPAVQNFQSNVSLIDPYADFLIGKTISANSRYSETQPVNMEFTRPVALFRLAIINMPDKDEKILSITVNADKALTGQVKQENIDFANGTATFDKSNGSNSLTVKYAGGAKISTIFYSYFVACPGTVNIQNVVVKTDGGEYTYKVGKDWTFSTANFDSIAIDMAKAEGGEEPGDTRTSQDLSFGDTLEFTYDMNEGGDFEEPVLTGAKTTPEYESDNTSVATVDKASGNVTFLKAGSVVITAVAPENDEYKKGQASYTITVYKAEEQTLTFTPASVSLKLGDAFTAPSLSGNKTGVTYTSNNESVATVTTAGAVTILGVGDATITATAAGTNDWKEASASYTIHVDPADEPAPSGSTTFYLVDALKAGEEGLIVSNGHALKNNNGAIAAIEVAPEDGEITISNDDVNSVVWAVSTAENQEYGSFSFTNNSDYVYVDGSYSSGYTLHIGAGSGVDKKYFTWAYDSAANEIKNGGTNAKRYLYYGSNTFTVSSSAGSTNKASFYSKNKPAPVEKKTYYKANTIKAGVEYIIVSNGKAIKNVEAENVDEANVTVSDGKIELTSDEAASILWKATAVNDTDLNQYGKFQFTNADEYLSRISGSSSTSVLKALPASSSSLTGKMKYTMWDYNGTQFINISIYNNSKTNYYATYNSGWKIATTAATAELYSTEKPEEGGDTPVDPTPAEKKTYYKANTIKAGVEYLIVSNGQIFKNNGGEMDKVAASIVDDTITMEEDETLLWTASANGSATLANGGKFLARSSSTASIGNSGATMNYDGAALTTQGSSSTYYFYYSDNQSKWSFSSSKSDSHVAVLYSTEKPEEGGDTPVDPTPVETKKYIKVNSNSSLADGTYLLVSASNTKALNSTGTQASTTVAPSSDIISSNDLDDCEFVIKSVSGGYTIKQANGSNYLARDNNNSTNYIKYSSSSFVFAKETKGTDLFCFQASDKTSEYLYYNSAGYFKIGGSGAPSKEGAGVILYKLEGSGEEGGDEPGPTPSDTKYYTKVTGSLPTSGEWNKVLFVYDNGDGTGYAFKGIYNGDVSRAPSGSTDSNTAYLTTEGNAVAVTITDKGIASSESLDACTLTMGFTSDTGKHNLLINNCNGYFRMLSSNGRLVIMSSAGYRMTYTVSSSGTNNVSAKRDSYYFSFNGTNFAGTTSSSAKFCIYNLAE